MSENERTAEVPRASTKRRDPNWLELGGPARRPAHTCPIGLRSIGLDDMPAYGPGKPLPVSDKAKQRPNKLRYL